MKMNSEYFVSLAATFEKRYGVEFQGIREGAVTDPRERLIQFKTNIDVVMSVLEKNGLGDWLADRLVEIGDTRQGPDPAAHRRRLAIRSWTTACAWRTCPLEPQKVSVTNPVSGAKKQRQDRAVPQARRGGGHAPGHLRDRQVAELRHRQPGPDARRRPLGVDQPRARQHLGPLRSRGQPARDAAQGGDPGGGQRLHARSAWSARARRSTRTSSPACGRSAAPTARSRR